jgi:hypothetical protein
MSHAVAGDWEAVSGLELDKGRETNFYWGCHRNMALNKKCPTSWKPHWLGLRAHGTIE